MPYSLEDLSLEDLWPYCMATSSLYLAPWQPAFLWQNWRPCKSTYFGPPSWKPSLAYYLPLARCPTSGAQTEWTALLAPPRYAAFFSWLTGWITTLGWQALTASAAFLGGLQIQGLVVLSYPDYVFERWHGTLIYWAILLLAFLINTVGIKVMPMVENGVLIFHVLTFLAVLIPLVVLSPHKDARYVFTSFENNSGWSSNGVAWCLGLLSSTYVLVGYDGACHLSKCLPLTFSILLLNLHRRRNAQCTCRTSTGHDWNYSS